ncbi:uncharacterized protein SPAPADRAFT_56442 [Spathaspora passalidarum NRRL Y-27907]|uniref:Alcohol acetyltransferase n=1 Tax=Spathaspora passalidarum (strain NRRL Y-27907 / 11-Y1) TaxID=619300 RepID=G3AQT3_SPAPN|nr:uncharacterized protein SPAPADRAFT_56442 [Spathaspora passalidarum NRRL Y-27907]EGW31630.1 hypothetical protein SPAPADRAFT_56442 [Spathaspora passalidarum NRRL Y-27907]
MTNKDILVTRPLSFSENFFRSRTASGLYRNFQLTATYNQNLRSDLRLLFAAIRKTVIDYHLLITNVQYRSVEYVYEPLKRLTLGNILSFTDSKYLQNGVINEQFMKEINEIRFKLYCQDPLFKLILVGDFDLCAVFEHTIADGLVGNYIHEILLENLAYCQEAGEQYDSLYGSVPADVTFDTVLFEYKNDLKYLNHSLPPPVDIFLEDIDLDYSYGDPNFHDKVTPPGLKKWKGRSNASVDYTLAFKLINFTPTETKHILARCKQEGVSITSYIQVIEALTLQPIYGDTEYTTHKVAMTLRRHYRDLGEATAPYNKILADKNYKILGTPAHMGFSNNHPPITEFSWDLARSINANIISGTKNTRALNQMKPFKDIADLKSDNIEFFTSQLNKPKADAIKISNLGFINLPVYPTKTTEWKITNMIFSQDLAPFAAEFMLSVVSTPIGGMNFVLSYCDNSFDDCPYDNFDGLVQDLRNNMVKYCK